MKCVIPSQNIKILSRVLHSLARIGDELFVEPNTDELVFRTVNMAQSAYGAVTFQKRFFSCYVYGDASDDNARCKISMKSCLMVFRTPHCMDRDVESCQIQLQPGCDKLVFQIKRNHGITKTNFLPIVDNDTLQANYSVDECVNKMCAEPKFLSSVVKNFRANEGEVTLLVSRQSTVFKNHIENYTDVKNSVRTELNLNAGEFEGYSVGTPTAVTFCLKELRAVLLYAEPIRMPVNIYFDTAGKPIVFTCGDKPLYEAVYVLSTLNVDAMSQTGPPKAVAASASVPSVEPNVCDRHVTKSSRKRQRESNSNIESNGSKTVSNNISVHNKNNSSNNNSINSKKNIGSNNNKTNNNTINESSSNNNNADSEYCQRNIMDVVEDSNGANQFNFPSTSKILSGVRPLSQQNSESTEKSVATQNTELAHIIFARCFNETFHKKDLPGYDKVLVYDSDGMEDSD